MRKRRHDFFLLLIMYTRYEQGKATIESLHTINKKKNKKKLTNYRNYLPSKRLFPPKVSER